MLKLLTMVFIIYLLLLFNISNEFNIITNENHIVLLKLDNLESTNDYFSEPFLIQKTYKRFQLVNFI